MSFPGRPARHELGTSCCLAILTLMFDDLVIKHGRDIGLPLQQPGAQSMGLIDADSH